MKLTAPSRAASTLALIMVLLVATTIFAQQLSEQRSSDGTTAKLVTEYISRYHISQKPVDDAISAQLFKRYLEQLDPRKLYFTDADIQRLGGYRENLDDQLKAGDVSFANVAFDLYLERLAQRVKLAHELIDAKQDFTVDEGLDVEADKIDWAKSEEEINDRWRKWIKFEKLTLILDDTPEDKIKERLHQRYHTIGVSGPQTEDSEKLEWYLSSLAHCFDPHSSYMSPMSREDFRISMELKLQGIGAALRSEDGYTIVASIVPGGAADKDGRLKKEDKIIGVDKGDGEMVDVVEMKLNKVVRMIRGKQGTQVRLKVKRPDHPDEKDSTKVVKGDTLVYELTRQTIELTTSEVRGEIIQTGDRLKGTHSRIGVVNIPSFYRDFQGAQQGDDFKSTSRDVLKVLEDFHAKGGVDLIVIDLRMNGGGALSEAIEVSGLFVNQGPIVQVKEPGGKKEVHEDPIPDVAYSGPLVVLCNRLSASASEIFAGVIKDYRRGIILGDTTTHGKGTVQNVTPVGRQGVSAIFGNGEDRGALKLTISQFYRVNGVSTQNLGVESDVVLPSLIDHMDFGEQFLDNALKADRIAQADDFKPLQEYKVTPEVISTLVQNSQARVTKDPEFQKLGREIDQYIVRKQRKQISLNLEKRRKERLEDSDLKNKEDKLTSEDPAEGPIFPENFYNNEVLRIGLDYTSLLQSMKTAGK